MDTLKSKSAYITFYKLVCFCLTMLSLYIIYKFGMTLWENRTPYVETFQSNILGNKEAPSHSTEKMLGHLKDTGISFGYMVAALLGVYIIKRFWKSLPVPGAFLKYWDEKGQISHLLGRLICSHLRNNLRFSNEEWVSTVNYSKSQTYYFLRASNSKNYANFFKKYDGNYRIDAEPKPAPALDAKTLSANKKVEVKTQSAVEPTIRPKIEAAPVLNSNEKTSPATATAIEIKSSNKDEFKEPTLDDNLNDETLNKGKSKDGSDIKEPTL